MGCAGRSVGIRTERRAEVRVSRGVCEEIIGREKKGARRESSGDDASFADVRFHNGLRSEINLASLAQVYSLLRLWQSGHHAGNSHH